jgi:hypothetical protein
MLECQESLGSLAPFKYTTLIVPIPTTRITNKTLILFNNEQIDHTLLNIILSEIHNKLPKVHFTPVGRVSKNRSFEAYKLVFSPEFLVFLIESKMRVLFKRKEDELGDICAVIKLDK